MVLETRKATQEEIQKIKNRYSKMKSSGELDRILARLEKKQKSANNKSGPHPHH